jgi:aminoglycoside phosphotransferase (APT) family kinase protein
VRELSAGEFNIVYALRLAGRAQVILRVAPPSTQYVPYHEADLMRHEHAIQPYLAPLAPLLPQTLSIDFTHQVLDRDYLFQTYMPGERWSEIASELTPMQEEALWHQFARLARTLHDITGEPFGHPYPGRQFPSWSLTIADWLERSARDAEHVGLDAADIRAILTLAGTNAALLDEIATPHLLHGDLWPFNILVDRVAAEPRITAVLDSDRVAWGDPLADWTFYLLPRRASPRVRAIFWDEYGAREETAGARSRAAIYEGLHAGNVLSDVKRRGRDDLLPEVRSTLHAVVASLQS